MILQGLGRYEEALEYAKKSLQMSESIYGRGHHRTEISLSNLASILSDLGRFEEALENQKRSLLISEKGFGTEHP